MQSFNVVEVWAAMSLLGRAVVVVLLFMSVWSLGVMVERLVTLTRARTRALVFLRDLADRLRAGDLEGARRRAEAQPQPPIARVVLAALTEYAEGRAIPDLDPYALAEAVSLAAERVKDRELAALRRGLPGLGTVASSAPFVGLFGTVVGIINAFRQMAAAGQGGLASVSAGIAEALVTTAFGLLVAIPAVVVFNHLTARADELAVDMSDVASELVGFVLKAGKR